MIQWKLRNYFMINLHESMGLRWLELAIPGSAADSHLLPDTLPTTLVLVTIVGILTFMSRINTSECFKQENPIIFQHFTFYEQLKFHA